jgi:CheY-like chemotaxis protein
MTIRTDRTDGGTSALLDKILVVEDSTIDQEVMAEMLAKVGFDADLAGDGREALERLDRRAYPLVLMDCQMPDMDGYAVTREIRRREGAAGRGKHTVVVALTAHALVGEREKAEAAGMDDFITKPVSTQALADLLRKWVLAESAAPPAPAEAMIDADSIHTPRIVSLFEKHGRADLDEIAAAMRARDAAKVAAVAHRLGGGCRSVGATRMARLCREIETRAKGGHPEVMELLAALDTLYEATLAELKALVAQDAEAASEGANADGIS